MAARLVGEAFLNSFIGVLVDRLSTGLVNLFQRKKLNRKSVEKLETTLKEARRLLNDAERKQTKDHAVKEWLSDLEDAVYLADDLLDGVSTTAKIQKVAGNSESHNYLNLQEREIIDKMQDIIERLESIVKKKDDLGLEAIPEENMSWRVTTSLVKQSDICGRDNDKEAVVELLLGDTQDGELSMISIWGMGGIGKTTLAQLVYNDERLKGKFNFTAWICVGENFDVFNVTKTILEAITSGSCSMTDLDLLQKNLKKKLMGKTFLIVLDDVWCEGVDEWNLLLQPLHYGNVGSKILSTTRNEKVFSVMPTVQPYKLGLLSDEDCWLVFLKHSFLSTECGEYAALESIGKKIVKKCKGLPLTAKTLGSLLRSKYDRGDWNDVLKSEIWEFPENKSKIIPALMISYHYLPSHLKRCFVYCSLFPQDHYFDKDELILLWMANDFLQPMGKKTLKEIGCVYFNELLARSFFQPVYRIIISDHYFVMHDLMHDLATFCAGKFYLRVEKLGSATEIDRKTHHLSFNDSGNYPISKLLTACQGAAEHMRTFVAMNQGEFDVELISQLKFLRVLSLKSYPPLDSLPDSIGDLIHLRYLDLSCTLVVTLPESFSKLYNLQTLKLHHCSKLKMLPSLGQLHSLKHLEISRCFELVSIGAEFYKSDESCWETPFRSLETLKFHGLDRWQEWRSLEFDDAFPQLKELTIDECPALIGDLPNHLPALEKLIIGWGCKHLACSLPRAPAMLELTIGSKTKLRMEELPLSLPSLSIRGNQLVESVLEAMTHTQPTCLRELHISDCDSAVSFPRDCLPSSLQELDIRRCKKLDFPMQQQQQHDSLRSLTIYESCDSLTSFPLNAFPNLTDLKIEFCENMKSLMVASQSHDTTISSLRSLMIRGCFEFASFPTLWMAAPQLESLDIWFCREIDSFPEGGLPPSLRQLSIGLCDKLESWLASMDLRCHGLTRLEIGIQSECVKSFPKEGWLPTSLEFLRLWWSPNLETLDCNGLSHLTSLRSLDIMSCDKLENMTGERLPASLTRLHIWDCPLLGERCRVKDPQIWSKISHIPGIEVGGKQITEKFQIVPLHIVCWMRHSSILRFRGSVS